MVEIQSEFDHVFAGATEASTAIKSCCQFEQKLKDLTAVVQEKSAPPEWIAKEFRGLMDSFPPTLVVDQRTAINQLVGALNAQVAEVAKTNPAMASVSASSNMLVQLTDLQVKLAEAGSSPTVYQQQEISKTAETVRSFLEAKQDFIGEGKAQEVKSVAETALKQVETANPLFGAVFALGSVRESEAQAEEKNAATDSAKERVEPGFSAEPAQKEGSTQEQAASKEQPSFYASEARRIAEPARSEAVAEEQRVSSRSASPVEMHTSESPAPPVSSSSRSLRVESPAVRVVSSEAPVSASRPTTSNSIPSTQRSTSYVSQSATRSSPTRTVSQPHASRVVTTKLGSSPVAQVAPKGAARMAPVVANGRVREGSTIRTRSAVQGRMSVGRAGAAPRGDQKAAAGRGEVRTREMGGVVKPSRLVDVASKVAGLRQALRVSRTTAKQVAARMDKEKVAAGESRGLQGDRAVRAIAPATLRRVATVLAQLRTMSLKEVRAIQAGRRESAPEARMAMAIRERAERLIERVRSLPLKELAKVKAFRSGAKTEAQPKGDSPMPVGERLAWREVRMYVRVLQQRLQSIINPRSLLYKRLTTELTLSDLERLISIIGGARAVKGLRRKHKAGEISQISESDISNSFLSQLAAAANSPASSGDSSSGSDDASSAQEVASPDSSPESDVEQATLVADGATPTATLTTVLVKEETIGNSVA